MAEETKNVQEVKEQNELTEDQLKDIEAQKKQAIKYYKSQTLLLKVRADYEEQKMRIATYQRDTLFAEYDMVRFSQQQKAAEQAAKEEEQKKKESNEASDSNSDIKKEELQ